MLYLAQNLKRLRKEKNLTQETAAELLKVSPQSVSKWERGETYPDITLLPALANLYRVSVDALLGMEQINSSQAKSALFTAGHRHVREGNVEAAAETYSQGLKAFPGDEGLLSELAFALALHTAPEKQKQAAALCERVLAEGASEKIAHTVRAALCFIYLKIGEREAAISTARRLPHMRESREAVLAELERAPREESIDSCLKIIILGSSEDS